MDSLIQDLRHALRGLVRAPAFSAAALLTLALGIGATAAIFSVAYAVLLKPLPYPAPDRLFVLAAPGTSSQTGEIFHHIRDRVRTLENVAAHGGVTGWNLVAGNRAEYARGMLVSRGYFDVIGVPPAIGRGFSVAEDEARGPRAVVLSHALAQRLFGGSRDMVGRSVQLSGTPYTVVGVMPATYWQPSAVELWMPLRLSRRDNTWNYAVIGRLRDDATEPQMAAEFDAIRSELRAQVRDFSGERADRMRWTAFQEWLGTGSRDQLILLLGAVAVLLLIACVNVASLQLVRAIARRREMATRAALGGGRVRLARQVLTESVLLSLAGAALGLLVASWGLDGLLTFVPEGLLGNRDVAVDARVVGTFVAIAVAVGVFFGLMPALGVMRLDVRTALWEGGRQSAGRHTMRLRRVFTAAQVALAVVLLAGAGVLIRSFVNLRSAPLGFDPDNVVIGKMSLFGSANQVQGGSGAFLQRTLADLEKVPGVSAVAVANNIPVERGLNFPIHPPAGGTIDGVRSIEWRWVSPAYFDVFRIPVRDGRIFDDRDTAQSTPVAIVNETLAKLIFGRPQVTGAVVKEVIGGTSRQIVGVVADVKSRSVAGWTSGINALAAPAPPIMYVPVAQVSDRAIAENRYFPMSWAIRTVAEANVEQRVRRVVQTTAPQIPFLRFETMESVIARDLEMQTFLMTLYAGFAAAALGLAAIGIYGLTAYSVGQRTQEVGIRMALGATRGLVLRSFMTEGVIVALVGLAAGLIAARFTTDGLSTMIFGLTPHDPATIVLVSSVLLGIAVAATLLPSLRAAQTNPARAMRAE